MQINPAVEQNKNAKWSESPWNQSCRKGNVYGEKDLPKSQVLRSEWKTERVREDECGDSEDGENEKINRNDWLNSGDASVSEPADGVCLLSSALHSPHFTIP